VPAPQVQAGIDDNGEIYPFQALKTRSRAMQQCKGIRHPQPVWARRGEDSLHQVHGSLFPRLVYGGARALALDNETQGRRSHPACQWLAASSQAPIHQFSVDAPRRRQLAPPVACPFAA